VIDEIKNGPIDGDDESRDGHYRPKRQLRKQSDESRRALVDRLEQSSDPDSLRAQNPEELSGTVVGQAYEEAAGLPAVLKTMQFGVGEMGTVRGIQELLAVNQKDGFDCQSCAWPNPDDHRKIAEFCENGAKAVADEGTRKRITRDFFARYSIDQLSTQSDYWLNQQGRLTEPMVRRLGAQHYTPIAWPEAFQLIAGELSALASPDEAAFYTSGKTANEPAFLLQLFARQFGTNNLPDCSNMCHESSGVALVETLGVGKGTVTLADFEQCDLILIFGSNPGTNHPRMLTTLEIAKRHGAKIIAVNPLPETGLMRVVNPNPQEYRNPLAFPFALLGSGTALTDVHLPVRINGDVAAIQGIMKVMFEEEAQGRTSGIDGEFIRHFTDGFESLEAAIRNTTWDEIQEGSGLSREQIRRAGLMCADARRMIGCWATGLTQHQNGVANVASVVNLLLLGGHIGRPGAGTCCIRGHSNVQGDRTMGVWERPPQRFLDALGREFHFTPPSKWGLDVVETLHAMHDGAVKVLFAISGNLVSNAPDTSYTAHAMRKCRLTVYVSTKLNRSHLVTGEQALILPCLGRSEKDTRNGKDQFVTVEDSMGIVSLSQGRFAPASSHLMSDVAIVAHLAHATIGKRSTTDWLAMSENYDLIREGISKVIPGFEDFNRRISEERTFYLPNAARDRIFKTASGKARFTACQIPKHDLAPDEYLLMTVRTHDQFNSTIYGLDDRYRGIFGGRRVIFLNPEDLAGAGWKAGQLVDIHSHFEGEIRKAKNFLIVPYTIPRRSAAAYYPETNVLAPIRSVAEKSNQPAYKCIRVTLHPSAEPVPQDVKISQSSIERNLQRHAG